ncbi:hypothetical protein ACOBV8_20170 (plasmid) [Pseudoalteromonas espejiana]
MNKHLIAAARLRHHYHSQAALMRGTTQAQQQQQLQPIDVAQISGKPVQSWHTQLV